MLNVNEAPGCYLIRIYIHILKIRCNGNLYNWKHYLFHRSCAVVRNVNEIGVTHSWNISLQNVGYFLWPHSAQDVHKITHCYKFPWAWKEPLWDEITCLISVIKGSTWSCVYMKAEHQVYSCHCCWWKMTVCNITGTRNCKDNVILIIDAFWRLEGSPYSIVITIYIKPSSSSS